MMYALRILVLLLVASQGATLTAKTVYFTEKDFNEAVEYFEKTYLDAGIPQAREWRHFRLEKNWRGQKMWFASRKNRMGHLVVPGQLARAVDGGLDTFTLAICREMGYLFAGYPAYKRNSSYKQLRANIGNSSYYSTFACTTLLWQHQQEKNAAYRSIVTPKAKAFCDEHYPDSTEAQNLCYRKITAAVHLGKFFNRDKPVFIDKPSTTIKEVTMDKHPPGQCILDTYLAGIACKAYDRWDHHSHPANDADIAKVSCATKDYPSDPAETIRQGLRPRCWYAPPAGL